MSKRTTRSQAVKEAPAKKARTVSPRDAWFDALEADGFLEQWYEEMLALFKSKVGEDKVKEASKHSYSKICHVLCDELCPGVPKVLEDDDSDEDPDEDAIDDEEVEEEIDTSSEEREIEEEEELELESDEDEEDAEDEEEEDEE